MQSCCVSAFTTCPCLCTVPRTSLNTWGSRHVLREHLPPVGDAPVGELPWEQDSPHACLRDLTQSQLRDAEGQEAATGKLREGYYSPRLPSDTCPGDHESRARCTRGSCQKALRKPWAQLFPLEKAGCGAGRTPQGEGAWEQALG